MTSVTKIEYEVKGSSCSARFFFPDGSHEERVMALEALSCILACAPSGPMWFDGAIGAMRGRVQLATDPTPPGNFAGGSPFSLPLPPIP